MEYTYRRVAPRGFDDTRAVVERAVAEHGFTVRFVHDLQATLAAKGFPIQALCIYELSLPDESKFDRTAARVLLPFRLHIYVEEDEVCVAAIRPTLAALMFPEMDFAGLDQEMEASVVELVDACT